MKPIPVIYTAAGPLYLRGSNLRAYNVERVRGYLEKNLGCTDKEICRALNLNRRTVANAIKTIREEQRASKPRGVVAIAPQVPLLEVRL